MGLRVTSGGGWAAALMWILAAGWTAAVAVCAVLVARSAIETSAGAWAALALFAFAALFLIALAIHATASAARFRGASIELQADPGVLGGKLAGVVHVPSSMPLQLTLSNWHIYAGHTLDDLLWESMTVTLAGGSPFSFDVPFDCEPTSGTASWRLLLELPDGSHSASFTVPVARTAESSPAQTQRGRRAAPDDAPAVTKVKVERGYDGTSVRFPLPSWTWKWYAIVLVLAAGAYLCAIYVWPEDTAMVVGIGVAGAIVLSAIPLPTFAMTVRRIDADRNGLTFHYVTLRRAKRTAAGDVGVAYANGALHYELTFADAAVPWTIITLRSRAEAEWVAYELRRALPQRA